MKDTAVSQLDRRRIEAELLSRVRRALEAGIGQEKALELLRGVSDESAREAGAAFAAQAPGGPGLAHFATILECWGEGNALDVRDVRLTAGRLTFTVTRCGYAEAYRAMGLDADMADILSCRRDFAFAAGYSPCLRLHRPLTLARDAKPCEFTFSWEE